MGMAGLGAHDGCPDLGLRNELLSLLDGHLLLCSAVLILLILLCSLELLLEEHLVINGERLYLVDNGIDGRLGVLVAGPE